MQEYIEGEEYTCGVLEQQGKVSVLAIGKVNTARKFFGFPEKNDAALNTKEIVPRPYGPVLQQLAAGAVQLFLELNLTNIARFDFIVRNDQIYFLECNQFPSLHQYSSCMLMLKEWKLTIADVVEIIINNERQRRVVDPLFRGYDAPKAPGAKG
jgi:D-alanine-D-alanine ligase